MCAPVDIEPLGLTAKAQPNGVRQWISFTYASEVPTFGMKRRAYVLHRHPRFPEVEWKVQHRFTHGRRYNASLTQRKLLYALIACGRDIVASRLAAVSTRGPPSTCRAYPRLASTRRVARTAHKCAEVHQKVAGLEIRPPNHAAFCQLAADAPRQRLRKKKSLD